MIVQNFLSKIATRAGKRHYCPEGLIISYFKYFQKFAHLLIYLVGGKGGYYDLIGLL